MAKNHVPTKTKSTKVVATQFNLKCCGNCANRFHEPDGFYSKEGCRIKATETIHSWEHCNEWKFDTLTNEKRK